MQENTELVPVEVAHTITVSKAAEKYGIPAHTLRYWRTTGRLSKYRQGNGDILFDEDELAREVAKHKGVYKES